MKSKKKKRKIKNQTLDTWFGGMPHFILSVYERDDGKVVVEIDTTIESITA